MDFLDRPTRALFFTGKGGVGKTSLACATAVALADARQAGAARQHRPGVEPRRGARRTLLGQTPTPIAGVPGLSALNIDPEAAARAYRERMVGPYRGVLPDGRGGQHGGAALRRLHRRDRRVRRVRSAARRARGDGGLRPRDLRHRADRAHAAAADAARRPGRASSTRTRPAPRASARSPGSQHSSELYAGDASRALGDAARDDARAGQPARASALARGGAHQRRAGRARRRATSSLVVNGVFQRERPRRPDRARARAARHGRARPCSAGGLRDLPRTDVPLLAFAACSASTALRALSAVPATRRARRRRGAPRRRSASAPSLAELIDELAAAGHGRRHDDGQGRRRQDDRRGRHRRRAGPPRSPRPSDHDRPGRPRRSRGRRRARRSARSAASTPRPRRAAYTAEVLATAGRGPRRPGPGAAGGGPALALHRGDRRLPRLRAQRSPRARTASSSSTPPRPATRSCCSTRPRPTTARCRARPATCPRRCDAAAAAARSRLHPRAARHAARGDAGARGRELSDDLARAGIEPFAWVINQSFAESGATDPVLAERAARERPYIREVAEQTTRLALVPWQAEPPVGAKQLATLASSR